MQIVGLLKLDEFRHAHTAARGLFDAWQMEVGAAAWSDLQDILQRHATASFGAHQRIVFSIKGGAFKLVTRVRFESAIVLIEWVGTQAEYGQRDWSQ